MTAITASHPFERPETISVYQPTVKGEENRFAFVGQTYDSFETEAEARIYGSIYSYANSVILDARDKGYEFTIGGLNDAQLRVTFEIHAENHGERFNADIVMRRNWLRRERDGKGYFEPMQVSWSSYTGITPADLLVFADRLKVIGQIANLIEQYALQFDEQLSAAVNELREAQADQRVARKLALEQKLVVKDGNGRVVAGQTWWNFLVEATENKELVSLDDIKKVALNAGYTEEMIGRTKLNAWVSQWVKEGKVTRTEKPGFKASMYGTFIQINRRGF